MAATILITKLFIPQARPELVPRPRLIEQLNRSIHTKLCLISAPAGFGKTTLITEWVQQTSGNSSPFEVAWLSLDAGDNDPTRFLAYLIAALNRIEGWNITFGEETTGLLQSSQPPPPETVLISLINEIARYPQKIILVLDDYHLIEAQPIHDALTFLLDNLPPQLHLVITTREDPLLPLSRMRARGELSELRARDLRFTAPETARFLNRSMGLDLSDEDVDALETRTEGWIAGLQLAAISLQNQADATKLIRSFTGSNRLILDYLIEEVLSQQPEEIQDFLLQTSVLDRLSGPLCDAVRFGLGKTHHPSQETLNGQAILEQLERANLFVIPLDGERKWYRYHNLFVDLLRKQLFRAGQEKSANLHARASAWFEQNGWIDDAIEHAFQADDFIRCASFIADLADPLWERGEHVKLQRWLGKLPDGVLCDQIKLCIYHAWFLFSTGHQEAADAYFHVIEGALAEHIGWHLGQFPSPSQLSSEPAQLELLGRLSAIHAMITSWGNDTTEIIQQASLALAFLPETDPWRCMAATTLGDAYYFGGDMKSAYETRMDILRSYQGRDDHFSYMIAALKVATTLREMGQLARTIEICQQQVQFAEEHGLLQTIFVGWALSLWAITLAECNELDQALEYATKGVELTRGGDLSFLGFSRIVLGETQFYRGDYAMALVTLEKLADIDRKYYLPQHLSGSLKAWLGRIYLAQNRFEDAHKVVSETGMHPNGGLILIDDRMAVVRARLLLAQQQYDQASKLLEGLIKPKIGGGSTHRLIETLALQALAKSALGETDQAINILERALKLAEPGGFIRVFVDEGIPMSQLLYEALLRGISSAYIQRILDAFPEDDHLRAKPEIQAKGLDLIEPLSDRELDVLQLIAEGFTNPQIAERLYLSLNTVKAHTRNIYGKLDVHNRTQAITHAQSIGLLPAG